MRTVFLLTHQLPAEYKRPGQYALWAEEHDIEVPDEFPITSLQRFFSKDNLKALGFDVDTDDELVPNMRLEDVKKMAATVCVDFATRRVKVEDVFRPDLAVQYIHSVRQMHSLAVPPPGPTSAPAPVPSISLAPGSRQAPAPSPSPTAGPATTSAPRQAPTPSQAPADRKRIFGAGSPGIGIPPTETKAATIVAELRKMDMNDTPLAAAVLLRALIEISAEYYRKVNELPQQPLAKKVRRCAEHMQGRGMLDVSQQDIITRLCDSTGSLIQVETLQKMVHSNAHHLDKQFVNTFWSNIGIFVKSCWR